MSTDTADWGTGPAPLRHPPKRGRDSHNTSPSRMLSWSAITFPHFLPLPASDGRKRGKMLHNNLKIFIYLVPGKMTSINILYFRCSLIWSEVK